MAKTVTVALAYLFFMASWALAQPSPLGPSFSIASGISEVSTEFDIAVNDDHFVLVWLDEPTVLVQRFALDGSPAGDQIIVTSSDPSVPGPAVALNNEGDFTVQWPANTGSQLKARSYRADGTPLTDIFTITNASNVGLYEDDIHFTRDGRLISGFIETDSSAGFQRALQNFKIDPDGSSGVLDSLFTDPEPLRSRLAGDGQIGFVQLAERSLNMIGGIDFLAHRLDPDGQPVGQSFVVPSTDAITERVCMSDLALAPDGSFVIVWTNQIFDTPDYQILARAMGSDDQPIGDPWVLNDLSVEGNGQCPSIARGSQGTYLVVWGSESSLSNGDDDSGMSIVGRQLAADGAPLGAAFQINDVTPGSQRWPVVRTAPGGNLFLVAWYQQAGTNFQLQGRLLVEPTFQDGFESGTTGGWSNAIP